MFTVIKDSELKDMHYRDNALERENQELKRSMHALVNENKSLESKIEYLTENFVNDAEDEMDEELSPFERIAKLFDEQDAEEEEERTYTATEVAEVVVDVAKQLGHDVMCNTNDGKTIRIIVNK